MKAEGLKYFTDIPLIVVGLLLFVACFLGFVISVYRRGSAEHYRGLSQLPLNEAKGTPEDSHVGPK